MPFGIDYAAVDGNQRPDFVAAKRAGCRFVIARAAYSTWPDPVVTRDRDAIRAAGLVFGSYLFPVMSTTAAEPEDQVTAFLAAAKLIPGRDMAPVLDLEWPGGIAKTGRTIPQIVEWIARACAAIRIQSGADPILYSSARVLDGEDTDSLNNAADQVIAGHAAWLARYPFKVRIPAVMDPAIVNQLPPPPVPRAIGDASSWWIHQYQGDGLGVPGFSSTTDLNRFNMMTFGATGPRVTWVQRRLGMAEGVPGAWDAAMEDAVYEFQRTHGLVADRIIGPATFAALSWSRPSP